MSDTATNISPPVARVYVSFVSALMGVHPKRTSSEVMKELRKQRSEEKPVIQQLLNTESYWTLVGMIKDAFEEPKSNHIDTMKTFIKEEAFLPPSLAQYVYRTCYPLCTQNHA